MTRVISACLVVFAACGGSQMSSNRAEAGVLADATSGVVIRVQASRWAYDPETIELQRGAPVTLELISNDVHHGFNVPALGLRADMLPGQVTRVTLTPNEAGTFAFHCDYFCGAGHEGMEGRIVVK